MNAILKDTEYRNPALTRLAMGEACQNCLGACCAPGSTVWAHSNLMAHGKGKSRKAHDCFGAFLGDRCHRWLDQPIGDHPDPTGLYRPDREDRERMWRRAADRTLLLCWRAGYFKVAVRK